jgi:hypothetical protein
MALLVIGAIAFVCAIVFAVLSAATHGEILALVNQALPLDQRLDWYQSRSSRLWAEYARLFPDGTLRRRMNGQGAQAGVAFAVFLICMVCAGLRQRIAAHG